MTLRKKTLISITLSYLVMIIALYITSSFIFTRSFEVLESSHVSQNMQRALNALSFSIEKLETTTSDWSSWDDSYAFVIDINEGFIESNLTYSTHENIEINFIIFINTEGQIIYGKGFDYIEEEEIPVPEELYTHLKQDNTVLTGQENPHGNSGLILLPDTKPLLVVSRPILTSRDEGPSRGTLVFARYFVNNSTELLSELLTVNIAFYRVDDINTPADVRNAFSSIQKDTRTFIVPIDHDYIAGYTLIDDIYGAPGLVMKITLPRDIYNEGRAGINYLFISISVVGIAFGIFAAMASDRFELSRLKQIVQGVDKISSRANPSERITVSGNDEITGLAESINDMLAALQQSEEVLKEKAAQLQRAVIEAQAANDAKTEFLAGVSHELRTPLTAIIGMTQLLEKQYYGKLNDKQAEYVKDILDSSAHLLSLINDILDLSRIESDKYEMEISGVPVKELLSESLLLIGPEARKKNIHFRQNITDEILNRTIFVDKRRFEQITVNILSNAVKFTPARGNITIEAEEKDNEMEFRITDTGTGIRHKDIERIFEAFYQADTGTAGKTPGTGLGLSLVRHLVELHHGSVRAESEGAGKGSRFIFTIPLDLSENRPALD